MKNKQQFVLIMTLVLALMPVALSAADFEIGLGNETANLEYTGDAEVIGLEGADIEAAVFFNKNDDFSIVLGLQTDGTPAGNQPLVFTLGTRLYLVETDGPDASVQALALGAGLDYLIPANTPMMVGGKIYYAPSVTAMGDADSLLDFRAQFAVDLLPNAAVFLGYRKFEVDLANTGKKDLDEDFHIGLRFHF